MKKANKWVILVLALLTIATFVVFIFPNKAGSENEAMVNIFEPDEYATFTVIDRMTSPKPDRPSFLQHYFHYNFYHYGFPYFSISSIPAFILRWTNQFQNTPLLMVSLRQFVNVLPSLIAILILVYIQDQFSSYKSILLYLILLTIPAIVQNNMWWHPDGLVFLLTALTLFFLWKDEQRFRKHFFIAAIFAGILTATKLIGVFFLAAIVPILLIQIKQKKQKFVEAMGYWALFAFIMAISFVIFNPFLFSFEGISRYAFTLYNEFTLISKGYDLVYVKGFAAAWKGIQPAYGSLPFFLAIIFSFYLGLKEKAKQKLSVLLLCWLVPLTFTVLFTTHFKYQYWLPSAIPAFSMLYMLFPDKEQLKKDKLWIKIARFAFLGVVVVQMVFFNIQNVKAYDAQLHREETSESIQFYHKAVEVLEPTIPENPNVYYDYRVYLPFGQPFSHNYTSFEMLDYNYIEEHKFDILLLINQRVKDYLNPNAEGVDQDKLESARVFYRDVRDNEVKGYKLLYEEDFGKVFIRDDWYEKYYQSP